ncbi:MAG TPA: hypothetical protein VN914_04305 [Polyangia bacterium]|nr:hypothetical protein [Polyangia bacterium]
MFHYVPPLHIHIAVSRKFSAGLSWAQRLERWFSGDETMYAVPEPNIPVFVWSDSRDGAPPDIPWTEADRSVLVVLTDKTLVADQRWRAWAERQWKAKRDRDRFLPCTVTKSFSNAGPGFQTANAIRLDRIAARDRGDDLLLLLTHSLARWLDHPDGSKPVRLFISHAKARRGKVSGRELALRLKAFIQSKPAGDVFFDEVGIAGGEDFKQALANSVEDATVVVLLTDAFSSRFWCGWEVVTSKHKSRPLLVVNALEEGELTSLAYIGKTPTIRWDATAAKSQKDPRMHRRIVAAALLEQLRLTHDGLNLHAIRGVDSLDAAPVVVAARTPELATLPDFVPGGATRILLHADPPLPLYERALVGRQRPDLTLVSASQALGGCVSDVRPLAGKRVAISSSDGPDRDGRGLSTGSQARLWSRLGMQLLSAGAELAYGGDLRSGGYTDQLIDLAHAVADTGQPLPVGVIHWYAGWPISARLTVAEKEKLPSAFSLHEGPVPAVPGKKPNSKWAPDDTAPERRFAWTVAMRDMRQAMARDCHARILVGGAYRGVSPWPGILEEFETFIGKPIFLIGAFGGTTQLLVDAIRGGAPAPFDRDFQDDGGKRRRVREYYEAREGPIDWGARLRRLQDLGVAGLANGLSAQENERLFVTRNLTEMLGLVLAGLRQSLGAR